MCYIYIATRAETYSNTKKEEQIMKSEVRELKEGYYDLTIEKVEEKDGVKYGSLGTCTVMLVTYKVKGCDITNTVKIPVVSPQYFAERNFFTSVGIDPERDDRWNIVEGQPARAYIWTSRYKGRDGKEHIWPNDVKTWVRPAKYASPQKIVYADGTTEETRKAIEEGKRYEAQKNASSQQPQSDLQQTRAKILGLVIKNMLNGDLDQALTDLNSIGLNTVKLEEAMKAKYASKPKTEQLITDDGFVIDTDELPF